MAHLSLTKTQEEGGQMPVLVEEASTWEVEFPAEALDGVDATTVVLS